MNDVFDILNARHAKESFTLEIWNNRAKRMLELFLTMIDDTDSVVKNDPKKLPFAAKTTLESWRMTLKSALALTEEYFKAGYSFVLTSKWNQDPIEVKIAN